MQALTNMRVMYRTLAPIVTQHCPTMYCVPIIPQSMVGSQVTGNLWFPEFCHWCIYNLSGLHDLVAINPYTNYCPHCGRYQPRSRGWWNKPV